ncbi:MAG: oligosaccharide flippase family protein, partial [Deltaproteobacteria bacterium]|nr:oligosaccharide flippase family protein [Deltaproteobacteria bacterium]
MRSVARGVAWVAVASALVAVFDLLALVLILRSWVSTAEFGTVSIVVTVFAALHLIGHAGLPAALVQREQPDEDRQSTVFWLGCASGLTLYAIVWCAAPLVAAAHGEAVIVPLFRVVGVMLVVRPLYAVHDALLRRELRFRELSTVRIVANAVELAVKLGVAMGGGGLWAFAIGPLARELTYAIGVPLQARWRPRWVCRPRSLGVDVRFGLRATGGELLYQIYSNLDFQIVAYTWGPAALGLYRAAYDMVLEPVRFVSGVVTVVAFPTFARLRRDRAAIAAQFIAFSRQNLVVVLLVVGIIVVAAGDLLGGMFGTEYAIAAPTARILAVVGVLRALGHLGPPLLDGVGLPGLSLRYQLVAAVTMSTGFFIAAHVGTTFTAIAIAWAVGYPIAFVVLWATVLGELRLGLGEYLRRVGRIPVLIALATAAAAGVHEQLAGVGAGPRLAITAVTVLVLGLGLLAWLE